nr:unnamed protein product [Spirometra erinaceieuropaei]
MDPTKILPLEIVQKVFLLLSPCRDLPAARLVSRRWKNILDRVFEMRVAASILALNTRSPLRWFQARPIETHDSSVPNAYPTSRFGATAIIKGHKLYVFGGATSEMTAFNDMWVYDLTSSYWNRITKRGELPSPRAFAKCGFVGNTLYLYGGCQTCYGLDQGARITWLDDMYSFCTETEIWKHVKLRRASEQMLQPPPVIAGQTGTFVLPSSSEDHFPAALVLFGGYSRLNGVTVNAGFVVLPNLCQWFELPDSMSPTKPAGRFGHATCSLGDCRILVVGGNLRAPQPPHMGLSSTPPSRASASPRTLEMRASVAVDGEPARDVWLLTRTECLPNQAYCNVSWFWTRVDCQYDGPECPPSDFYHAVAVGLPIFGLLGNNATQPSDGDADDYKECTSDLLGAPSTLPDSASGNSGGDGDVRDFFPASVVLISTATKRLISLSAGYRVQSRKRCMTSRGTSDSSISPVSPLPPPSPCSSEAKPLAAYTLRLSIPKNRNLPSASDLTRLASPTAVWLGPGKPCLGELSSAPHECLGFSSVYGFGSIFLFGGLSTATSSDPKSGGGDNGVNLLPGDHSVERCSEGANIEAPPWNSEPSRAGQMTHRSETNSCVRKLNGSVRGKSSLETPALYVLHSAESAPQVEINIDFGLPPTRPEIIRAVQQLSNVNVPGSDARQLQEKCQEMRTHLGTTLDLAKAFDTENYEGLGTITWKFGRTELFTHMPEMFAPFLGNPRNNPPVRRTTLVTRELARYKVDIAALSETRFSEQSQLEEVGVDYIFFWNGRPMAERRDAGVTFAIRNDTVGRLPCLP